MIPVALAYIWLIFLGEYAFQKGYNIIIHRTERCDLSLFKMGYRLLKYLIKQYLTIPPFSIYLPNNSLNFNVF